MSRPGIFGQFQCVAQKSMFFWLSGLDSEVEASRHCVHSLHAIGGISWSSVRCWTLLPRRAILVLSVARQMASSTQDICLTFSHHTWHFFILKLPNLSLVCMSLFSVHVPFVVFQMWKSLYWCRRMSYLYDLCMHDIWVCLCYPWYGVSGLCECMCLRCLWMCERVFMFVLVQCVLVCVYVLVQ